MLSSRCPPPMLPTPSLSLPPPFTTSVFLTIVTTAGTGDTVLTASTILPFPVTGSTFSCPILAGVSYIDTEG